MPKRVAMALSTSAAVVHHMHGNHHVVRPPMALPQEERLALFVDSKSRINQDSRSAAGHVTAAMAKPVRN